MTLRYFVSTRHDSSAAKTLLSIVEWIVDNVQCLGFLLWSSPACPLTNPRLQAGDCKETIRLRLRKFRNRYYDVDLGFVTG